MNCEQARALFPVRADERITPEERAELTGHLAVCPVCPGEWDRYLQTVILLRSAGEPQAPPGFAQRVIEAATREPWHQRWLRAVFLPLHIKLPLEAVAIVVVSTLVVLVYRQGPEGPRVGVSPPSQVAPTPAERQEGLEQTPEEPSASPATPSTASPERAQEDKDFAERKKESNAPEKKAERDRAESRVPAATAPSLSASQSLFQVSGLLRPKSRDALDRQLEDLASQVGGTLVIETSVARSGSVVEFVLARDNYAKLETGLHQMGDFKVEAKAPTLPEQVRVRIRIQ